MPFIKRMLIDLLIDYSEFGVSQMYAGFRTSNSTSTATRFESKYRANLLVWRRWRFAGRHILVDNSRLSCTSCQTGEVREWAVPEKRLHDVTWRNDGLWWRQLQLGIGHTIRRWCRCRAIFGFESFSLRIFFKRPQRRQFSWRRATISTDPSSSFSAAAQQQVAAHRRRCSCSIARPTYAVVLNLVRVSRPDVPNKNPGFLTSLLETFCSVRKYRYSPHTLRSCTVSLGLTRPIADGRPEEYTEEERSYDSRRRKSPATWRWMSRDSHVSDVTHLGRASITLSMSSIMPLPFVRRAPASKRNARRIDCRYNVSTDSGPRSERPVEQRIRRQAAATLSASGDVSGACVDWRRDVTSGCVQRPTSTSSDVYPHILTRAPISRRRAVVRTQRPIRAPGNESAGRSRNVH